MDLKRGAKLINILLVIAMVISLYLVYLHYAPEGSSFCDISEGLSCDAVNKSEWSELFGIPVSILGYLTFLALFLVNMFIIKDTKEFSGFNLTKKGLVLFELIVLGWSILYSYGFLLFYVEYYKLKGTYCLLCLTLDVLILAMFIIALLMYKKIRR